jgi:hypothetical protein
MKTCWLLVVLVTLVASHAEAAQAVPGTIFYFDGHKEEIKVMVHELANGKPDFSRLEKCIRYKDINGEKKSLYPDDAQKVRIWFDGKTYWMKSILMSTRDHRGRKLFVCCLVEGRMSLFLYQTLRAPRRGSGDRTVYLLRHVDGRSPKPLFFDGFKKTMGGYFSDCPALMKLIENRTFKERDMEEIVTYYNSKCE